MIKKSKYEEKKGERFYERRTRSSTCRMNSKLQIKFKMEKVLY